MTTRYHIDPLIKGKNIEYRGTGDFLKKYCRYTKALMIKSDNALAYNPVNMLVFEKNWGTKLNQIRTEGYNCVTGEYDDQTVCHSDIEIPVYEPFFLILSEEQDQFIGQFCLAREASMWGPIPPAGHISTADTIMA